MISSCDRCGKRFRSAKDKAKIRYGSWKTPETNDWGFICGKCYEIWGENWKEKWGKEKITASPQNHKVILEMWSNFMESGIRIKVKVIFT